MDEGREGWMEGNGVGFMLGSLHFSLFLSLTDRKRIAALKRRKRQGKEAGKQRRK